MPGPVAKEGGGSTVEGYIGKQRDGTKDVTKLFPAGVVIIGTYTVHYLKKQVSKKCCNYSDVHKRLSFRGATSLVGEEVPARGKRGLRRRGKEKRKGQRYHLTRCDVHKRHIFAFFAASPEAGSCPPGSIPKQIR